MAYHTVQLSALVNFARQPAITLLITGKMDHDFRGRHYLPGLVSFCNSVMVALQPGVGGRHGLRMTWFSYRP